MPAGPGFGNLLGGIASELCVSRSVRDSIALLKATAGNTRGPYADVTFKDPADRPLRVGVLTDTGTDRATAHDETAADEGTEPDQVGICHF